MSGREPYYMCQNGHLVKDKMLAGKECGRCRYNQRRRVKGGEAEKLIRASNRRIFIPCNGLVKKLTQLNEEARKRYGLPTRGNK